MTLPIPDLSFLTGYQEANKAEGGEAPTEEVTKAKEAIADGMKSLREVS
jgi:hypothetical protein